MRINEKNGPKPAPDIGRRTAPGLRPKDAMFHSPSGAPEDDTIFRHLPCVMAPRDNGRES